jgi:hypothetical protein
MSARTFVKRATIETAALVGVAALAAAGLGGPSFGVGVLAGGALAVANLWWLTRRVDAMTAGSSAAWPLGAVVRLAAAAGAIAVVLGTGLAHPVGVVAGLTVLPCVLVIRGLAAAKEA